MAFSIHARGLGGFLYKKANCIDDDIFKEGEILSRLRRERSGGTKGARKEGLKKIAKFIAIDLLIDGLTLILAESGNSFRWSIYVEKKSILFPDKREYIRLKLSSEDDIYHSMRSILKTLKKCNMNNFGVLMQIGITVSKYSSSVQATKRPMLMISLNYE